MVYTLSSRKPACTSAWKLDANGPIAASDRPELETTAASSPTKAAAMISLYSDGKRRYRGDAQPGSEGTSSRVQRGHAERVQRDVQPCSQVPVERREETAHRLENEHQPVPFRVIEDHPSERVMTRGQVVGAVVGANPGFV
jgi:hypothetical protein